jgi:hypothetical protein
MGYQPELWQNYFAAQADAAAAPAGLVFVAVSLNLKVILRYPTSRGEWGNAPTGQPDPPVTAFRS